jgi:hypothetical protein
MFFIHEIFLFLAKCWLILTHFWYVLLSNVPKDELLIEKIVAVLLWENVLKAMSPKVEYDFNSVIII